MINSKKYHTNFFTEETIYVFSIIMTLLEFRLQLINYELSKKFYSFYYELENEKYYKAKKGMLSTELYNKLLDYFKVLFYKDEKFIDILFIRMKELTKKKPDLMVFYNYLDSYYA